MTRNALALISGFAVLAVLGYNLWAYCCGRCSAENFVRLGPFDMLLTGVTVLAGVSLMVVKTTRLRHLRRSRCLCGFLPASVWAYCPRCGIGLQDPSDPPSSAPPSA